MCDCMSRAAEETLSWCSLMHRIENLRSNLSNHLCQLCRPFWIFSLQNRNISLRGRFISPGPQMRSPPPPSCLAITFSNHSAGVFGWCSIKHISLPLIVFRLEPHALPRVCATANVCLRVKECKPPLLISPLCWSHRAEEWEAGKKKERIMMREKHSSGSLVHPHCSAQHSSSALLSCLSSEPHANA